MPFITSLRGNKFPDSPLEPDHKKADGSKALKNTPQARVIQGLIGKLDGELAVVNQELHLLQDQVDLVGRSKALQPSEKDSLKVVKYKAKEVLGDLQAASANIKHAQSIIEESTHLLEEIVDDDDDALPSIPIDVQPNFEEDDEEFIDVTFHPEPDMENDYEIASSDRSSPSPLPPTRSSSFSSQLSSPSRTPSTSSDSQVGDTGSYVDSIATTRSNSPISGSSIAIAANVKPEKLSKANKVIGEIRSTEDSFLTGAQAFLERLGSVKSKFPKDQFILKFHFEVEKGVQNILKFNKKLRASTTENTDVSTKIKDLASCYSTVEFERYGKSMTMLTLLYNELMTMDKDKYPKLFTGDKHSDPKLIQSSQPIIFAQRMPRHRLLLEELKRQIPPAEKLELELEILDDQKIDTALEKIGHNAKHTNTCLLYRDMFMGLNTVFKTGFFERITRSKQRAQEEYKQTTLKPWMERAFFEFDTFVEALHNIQDYVPNLGTTELKALKQQLVHYALHYNTDFLRKTELTEQEKTTYKKLEKDPLFLTNDQKASLERASHFRHLRVNLKNNSVKELQREKSSLKKYVGCLKILKAKKEISADDEELLNQNITAADELLSSLKKEITSRH